MKKIVIIGGGFAGSYCARHLENDFDVTLIDSEDYFEFTPSVLRTLVEPEHVKKIQALHKSYLKKALIVKGEVESVSDERVLAGNNSFSYDYLVICSGSRYNVPIKARNLVVIARAKELKNYADQLKKIDSVLIIGGGIVGVELAAEIIEKFPDKKITLIHSRDRIMPRMSPKAQKHAQNFLEKRGVKIILNEKAMVDDEGHYMTNGGGAIDAEMAFICTGILPNYEALEKHFSTSLNEKNYVSVNPNLMVRGHRNIFAVGDINNVSEEKLAQCAEKQAAVAVKNIFNLEKGRKLKEYHSKPRIIVVSLGKHDGVICYKNFVMAGWIAGFLKRVIEWKSMRKYR